MSSKSTQHYTSVFPNYCDRAGRNSYAAALIQEIETKFGLELSKGLNLGSDGAQLEKVSVLQGSKVDWLELDMQNDPPFFIDLDKIERLDFENEKFDKTINILKSADRNKMNDPNYISALIESADKTSLVSPEIIANVMRNFDKDMLQVNNSSYRTSSLARTEGLNDALVAIALISAGSNFDSSDVKAVAK